MINTKSVQVIGVDEWDGLVIETYGKPYSFQQQDGCKPRGKEYLTVPISYPNDYEDDTIPEVINGREMGVSFKAWLARDPEAWYGAPEDKKSWTLGLFWDRNFYPSVDMIANDLHEKGLLPAGEYMIDIDW